VTPRVTLGRSVAEILEDIAGGEGVLALAATRDTAMTGSFLRASLFTSVVGCCLAGVLSDLGCRLTYRALRISLRRDGQGR
jgi:hypothetical protein